jgi:hypothetical protein
MANKSKLEKMAVLDNENIPALLSGSLKTWKRGNSHTSKDGHWRTNTGSPCPSMDHQIK